MLVNQHKDDIEDAKKHKEYKKNQDNLKRMLNSGRQLSSLFTALLHRPGASASPEVMSDAIEELSSLHKDLTHGVANNILGTANEAQLAMVGRSLAFVSSKAWVYEMQAEDAAQLYLGIIKSTDIDGEAPQYIDNEELQSQINKGAAVAKLMPIIMKLDELKEATQELYIGQLSPLKFAAKLNDKIGEVSGSIVKQIAEHVNDKDGLIAKNSVQSVVAEIIAASAIAEMNTMSREMRNMAPDERKDYLAAIKETPDGFLLPRSVNGAIAFIEASYAGTKITPMRINDAEQQSESPGA